MLSLFPQSSGAAGVRQTLSKMARLTAGAQLDPAIRDQAALAVSGCPKGHKVCFCAAVLSWTNRKVHYVGDPNDHELLHDPRLMARGIAQGKRVYGDCDDMSMYIAALLKSIGLQPWFRAVGYDGKPFAHVYVVCEGVKLDATRDYWSTMFRHHVETSIMNEKV